MNTPRLNPPEFQQKRPIPRFTFWIVLLAATVALAATPVSPGGPSREIFSDIPLSQVSPSGWQREYLMKQRRGLTGQLDVLAEPFNQNIWTGDKTGQKPPFYKRTNSKGEEVLCWEPYEQTGYYYDGAMRAGLLLEDEFLIEKANKQIFGSIAEASPEGVIAKDVPDRWGHVVFFRAMMAAYDATGDKRILDALLRHYENDTYSLAGARNILNIEQLLWLYGKTGKQEFRDRSIKLYEAMASRKSDRLVNRFDDLKSPDRQDIHGVTFLEMLKLPILLHNVTGDPKYLAAVRNGYRKLDKYHMLACGVNSSEEGLSERHALSAYETCDVADFAWTTGYMLKATGEPEWAERIERAILNAGLASVTADFDAHAYFNKMNHVVSVVGGNTSPIMGPDGGATNMTYAQRQMPLCCTGNVNRFFPIYVGLQWLRGADGGLVKALYGPGSVVHRVGDAEVEVVEESMFPFGDEINLRIAKGSAKFPMTVRIPSWTTAPVVRVNGEPQENVQPGAFFTMTREWRPGDVITLDFPKKPTVREWEMNGAIVEYGPLLLALPVPAKVEKVLLKDWLWSGSPSDSQDLYAYNLLPDGKWRYVLALDEERNHMARVVENPAADPNDPWNPANPALKVQMVGLEMPPWAMHYQEYDPFGGKPAGMVPITPPLPPRGSMIMVYQMCKEPEAITLVPFGGAKLRLAVFPYWDVRDIPSFRENQVKFEGSQ